MKGKLLSRVQLFATSWTAAYQASPSMGFSRQEYWSGVPSPSPQIRLRTPITAKAIVFVDKGWVAPRETRKGHQLLGEVQRPQGCQSWVRPLGVLHTRNPQTRPQLGSFINVQHVLWRGKWQPTLVFLPGEFCVQRSLVDCCPWCHTEADMTEAT